MAAALGVVGLATTIAGGAASAIGAGLNASSQASMYRYQANLAQINQELAYQQGANEAQQYGLKAGQQMGLIKATQGASGLDVNSGSTVAVREGQEKVTSLDNLTIRSNAAKTAYNYASQAEVYKTAAANVEAAAPLNIAGSILGTTASVASKWLTGQQMGLWGQPQQTTYPTIAQDQL